MQCGHRRVFALRSTPLLLLAVLVNARSAVSLKGELLADRGSGSGSSDEDVDELGGELQNLMSNLEGASPSKEEEESEDGAQLLEDGRTDVDDGAMSQIQTQLSAEELKNAHLKQQLAQADTTRENLHDQARLLQKQLQADKVLQKRSHDVAEKQTAKLHNEVSSEQQRVERTEQQTRSLRQKSEIREKAIKDVRDEINMSIQKVAELRLNINLSDHENEELRGHLRGTAVNTNVKTKLSSTAQLQMDAESQEQAETNAKLSKLETAKKTQDEQVALLEQQRNLLWERQLLLSRPEQLLREENQQLKKRLGVEKQREKLFQQAFSNRSKVSNLQLQQDRISVSRSLSELEKTNTAIQKMREEAERLSDISFKVETAQNVAEQKIKTSQAALAEKAAENKQLKEHTVPWLELQVTQQREEAKRAKQLLQQASDARDTATAVLSGAQKNIVEAQGRYAEVLRAVTAVRSGASASQGLQSQYADASQANQQRYPGPQGQYADALQSALAAQMQTSLRQQQWRMNAFAPIQPLAAIQPVAPTTPVSSPAIGSIDMEGLVQVLPDSPALSFFG